MSRAQKASRPRRAARGFTIIEVAVVITIAGLVFILGLPAYTTWTANARVRSAAEAAAAALRQARNEAVSRNTQVQLVFTNSAPVTSTVTAAANGTNWVIRVAAPAIFITGRPIGESGPGIQVNASQAITTFDGAGRLAAGGGPITIDISSTAPSSRPLRLVVARGGGIRMCDPARAAGDAQACA